jgi:hypothetical protein
MTLKIDLAADDVAKVDDPLALARIAQVLRDADAEHADHREMNRAA